MQIRVDLSPTSSLKWNAESLRGHSNILWELDCGLFDSLKMPIDDPAQFLTLELALKHFRKTLFPVFESVSSGAILYKGPLVDEAKIDYLKLLLARLPEDLPAFLIFEVKGEANLLRETMRDRFSPFRVALTQLPPLQQPFYIWNGRELITPEPLSSTDALCLPTYDAERAWELLEKCLPTLPLMRAIPQGLLGEEWEGVERLFVIEEGLSAQTRRKLRGFEAAGGVVESLLV